MINWYYSKFDIVIRVILKEVDSTVVKKENNHSQLLSSVILNQFTDSKICVCVLFMTSCVQNTEFRSQPHVFSTWTAPSAHMQDLQDELKRGTLVI